MCGIAGIVSFQGDRSFWVAELATMVRAIAHRGNNGQGWYEDPTHTCFLGHRRLAIIDLSDAASQPMTSSDGRYVMVFNGEIYNYRECARELEKRGVVLRTTSDTEVLLESYRLDGVACVHMFRGMFACAIWDTKDKKLVAFRDHAGIKPFYWTLVDTERGKGFLFASELKGIMASSAVDCRLSAQGLYQYLSYYSVQAPLTLLDEVFSLPPGHVLVYDERGVSVSEYWSPFQVPVATEMDAYEAQEKAARLLDESVALAMRADINVGAFLSGGLDSSTIVGLMSRHTEKPIETFSIGFAEHRGYTSELSLAQLVSKKYGTTHHEVVVDEAMFKRELDHFIEAIDQPSGDGINSYLVSKVAAEYVSVALSGLGGDELFLGYGYVADMLREEWAQSVPGMRRIIPYAAQWYQRSPYARSLFHRMGLGFLKWAGTGSLEERYDTVRRLFSRDEIRALVPHMKVEQFSNALERQNVVEKKFEKNNETERRNEPERYDIRRGHEGVSKKTSLTGSFLQAATALELSQYVPTMLLRDADATAMAFTLEVRFPFLDQRLVELLLSMPYEHKVHRGQKVNKPLLVSFYQDLIPDEVLRAPKRGFEMPVGYWLLAAPGKVRALQSVPWLKQEMVSQMVSQFERNPGMYLKVWSLVVLQQWCERFGVKDFHETDFVRASWYGVGRGAAQSVVHDQRA